MRRIDPMLRTFGFSKLGPRKENRIIFYSILLLLLITLLYILSFYGQGNEADGEEGARGNFEKEVGKKRYASEQAAARDLKKATPFFRSENFFNFSSGVEPLKSFT